MSKKQVAFIDRSDRVLNFYLKSISKYPILSADEETALMQRAQQGDKIAKERVLRANLCYVVSVAKTFWTTNVDLKDLIESGNLGLIMAMDNFDPSLGYRFLTYADGYIRKAIRETLASNWLIHIPENEYLAIKAGDAENIYIDSLDAPISATSETTLCDTIALDESERPDAICEHDSLMDTIRAAVDALPEKQAKAIRMSYGLDDNFEHGLSIVASELGVSRERARQITNDGIKMLKTIFNRNQVA